MFTLIGILNSVGLLTIGLILKNKNGGQCMDTQMQMAIISAASGLLGAIIGAASTIFSTWFAKKIEHRGNVTLHARIVYNKSSPNMSWGFYNMDDSKGMMFIVPIWLDVCNTCSISRVVRDINLYAYNGNKEVSAFTQIQRIEGKDSKTVFGDNESYTLVIQGNGAGRYDMQFVLFKSEIMLEEKTFDSLVLKYYDEKNRIHAYFFTRINGCWKEGKLPLPQKWFSMTKQIHKLR